jgi:plastocyanin domain-containing protein
MKKYLLMSLIPLFSTQAFTQTASIQNIDVKITEKGWEPSIINVKPGTELTLNVTRVSDQNCSSEIQVPSKNIKKTPLPLNKTVSIRLGKLEKGEVRFGCGMNMMEGGVISVR